jgi:hypothetical protein
VGLPAIQLKVTLEELKVDPGDGLSITAGPVVGARTVTAREPTRATPAMVVLAVSVTAVSFVTVPVVNTPAEEMENMVVDQVTLEGDTEVPSDNVAAAVY